jgi:hypothetical protein
MSFKDKLERYKELNEDDRSLTNDERKEFFALRRYIEKKRKSTVPMPKCCLEIQNFCTVYASVDIYDTKDSSKEDACWKIQYDFEHSLIKKSPPSPQYCPWCGTKLPELVRKKNPPTPICVVNDGGYYCSVCKERLIACDCLSPEAAWECKL